jgi:hypothetical protein
LAGVLVLACGGSWGAAQQAGGDVKTGEFRITFTEHHPLAEAATLQKRLGLKEPPGTYELDKEPFVVDVPKDYDPATPQGLIVYLCYKNTDQGGPVTILDNLAKRKIIFVTPLHKDLPDEVRAAQAVDAVHNLSKQYNIDPQRIWIFGSERATVLAATAYPDVFVGGTLAYQPQYWKPIKAKNGGTYRYDMAAPPPQAMLPLAKQRRWVIGVQDAGAEFDQLVVAAFKREGFKATAIETNNDRDYHYPHFNPEWFERVMDTLESARATSPGGLTADPVASVPEAATVDMVVAPASKPTAAAKPAVSDAAKQLSLAQSYIASGAYTPARTKLNAIVEKYPEDPAAAEAKKLLEQIKGK